MGKFQLAQINVAQAKAEMDTDAMSGFVSRLDEINRIAKKIVFRKLMYSDYSVITSVSANLSTSTNPWSVSFK